MWKRDIKIKSIIKVDITMFTSGSEKEFNFWSQHNQLGVSQKRRLRTNWWADPDEVLIYLVNPICVLIANPLEKWEDMKLMFPSLHNQARIFLNIVGTSVSFSQTFKKIVFGNHYKIWIFFIAFVLTEWMNNITTCWLNLS